MPDNDKITKLLKIADERYDNEDYIGALEYFEEYIKLKPYDALVLNMIGFLYRRVYGNEALDEQIKKEEQEAIEEKEEQERQVAAILEKDFLENKRKTLQTEIDSITHILGDAQSYYKNYIDLVKDLKDDKKQEPPLNKEDGNKGEE